MVGVHALSEIDRGFNSQSGEINDYRISTCCFYSKHAAFKSKSKDWLAQNRNNE